MYDLMFKATNKEAWDAFVSDLSDEIKSSILIDEIGPIVIDSETIDNSWHVNVRVISDAVDCAVLAEGNLEVEWIDPSIVSTPERIWAGGMRYWIPPTN